MKGRSSVALGFLALIAVGSVVLAMPWARNDGTWGALLPSLFTACSAVCVTGLTVVDIAREYTFAGQVALTVLVEIGCLGLMTCGTFLMIAIGRRLSLASEFSLMNAYGTEQVHGLRGLICWVVGTMVVVEGLGALALYVRFRDVWKSCFFSVMAFCNAGFSILPNSVAPLADDPYVVVTLAVETILGGIGFLVVYNLCNFFFSFRRVPAGRRRLSLHTKVVLRVTAYLLVVGLVVFLALEWNNALSGLSSGRKFLTGFYQAVTPRTCGFSIVPTESLHPLTRLFYCVLMFIGGAPGSAAAGIKVTTLAVLFYTLRAMCRGENETVISRRIVTFDTVRESIVIFMALVSFAVVVTGALLATEHQSGLTFEALLFEAVSAITTTGLEVEGTTEALSVSGKVVIMCAMFAGRLGALTVVLMIGDRETTRHIRFATEELVVG